MNIPVRYSYRDWLEARAVAWVCAAKAKARPQVAAPRCLNFTVEHTSSGTWESLSNVGYFP